MRDVVTHIFGSGFPKSLNVGKQTGLPEHTGIGTALKPASEHWILVRKPLGEKTVAANTLKHGTGGINIDASRISVDANDPNRRTGEQTFYENPDHLFKHSGRKRGEFAPQGRFPANLVLSHNDDCVDSCTPGCAVAMLDAQSLAGGMHSAGGKSNGKKMLCRDFSIGGEADRERLNSVRFGDSGGASRFFYCAKASKKDKGADNVHPTVKSSTLMSYLIKLITPPNGIVLDPFMGSGSTGVAAIKEGFDFIGIEKETEYYDIASKRLDKAS